MRTKTWSQYTNWHLVLPPSRPDVWQLKVIASYLATIERSRPIAVLGSTIEFRDLLAEMGFTDVYVLELNQHFYELVSAERIYRNKETVIWGDWLETLHKIPTRFHAILSDLTSGNVSYENRSMFYSGVAKSLHREGVFLDRILTHSIPHERLDRLTAEYQTFPINISTLNRFSCEFIFCSELLAERDIVDSNRFYATLRLQLDSPRLQHFIDLCHNITPADCVWWYGKPWVSLAPAFENNLRIVNTIDEPPHSAYAGRAKLFVAQKRASLL